MKFTKAVIIVLVILLIIGPLFTFLVARKLTEDSCILYSLDGLSGRAGPNPNTSSESFLNNSSRSNVIDGYTSVGNGTQVATLDSDLFFT